jgi:hypothetical protein
VWILDPNWVATFALATAVVHRFPPPLAAIEAAHGLGRAGAPLEDALTVVELEEEGHPHRAHCFGHHCRPLRSRSHQEWRTGESITVYSGEPPLWARHVIAVALPLPAELPRVVRPGVNSWDPIPLHDLISCVHLRFHDSRWSGPFKGLWTKVPWTWSTAPWTYSMRFSLEK